MSSRMTSISMDRGSLEKIFFNSEQRLRNGWWILVFIGFVAITRLVYRPIAHRIKDLGISASWLKPASFIFVLLATWTCTRLRKEPLSSIGFQLDRRWLKEIVLGTLLGTVSLLIAVGLIWAFGGVHFELNSTRSISTVAYGFFLFLFVAFFEETLFRGFVFQRLLDGTGIWFPQILLALLFAMGAGLTLACKAPPKFSLLSKNEVLDPGLRWDDQKTRRGSGS